MSSPSFFFRTAVAVLATCLLASCGKAEPSAASVKPAKELSAYKILFEDTFRNYQTATTEIPKKGKFDFEITTNVDGNADKIDRFAGKVFSEGFSSFSTRAYGEYDFENPDSATFSPTLKAYLNKGNTGEGDIDLEAGINASGSLAYEVRNLDARILKFLGIDDETAATLIKATNENKGQKQVTELGTNLLKEVLATISESKKNGPLYENSKEEEKQIIDAFAKSETVEILSGSWLNDSTERLSFRFNPENFSKFLNETAKILKKGNENKDFSGDAKALSETVRIEGTMDIREKRIIDSDFKAVLRIGGTDAKTGEKIADDLVAKIRFALPNPSRLDFDLDVQTYANSSSDNVLRLRLK
jgi:hypothetical protein